MGDLQLYDIVIFAAIAVFLVFRLRNVLGKRTGFEKHQNADSKQAENILKSENNKKNIPELPDKISELKKAYEALDEFDHDRFLIGAKAAFETIINSFNLGKKAEIKNLLTKEVFGVFEKAIDDKNNDPESEIFSLVIEGAESVVVKNSKIIVNLKFVSQQIKNGDESSIIKKIDVWGFEKNIKSRDPKWLLCST